MFENSTVEHTKRFPHFILSWVNYSLFSYINSITKIYHGLVELYHQKYIVHWFYGKI